MTDTIVIDCTPVVQAVVEITPEVGPFAIEIAPGIQGLQGVPGSVGPKGQKGDPGSAGSPGSPGSPGIGLPPGGTTGQVPVKLSNTNYDIGWANQSGGSGGSGSILFDDQVLTLTTTVDGDPASLSGLTRTPNTSTSILVYLDGIMLNQVHYGDKTGSCYWSNDAGGTSSLRGAVVQGTKLFWNGSIAGFQLLADSVLRVVFETDTLAPPTPSNLLDDEDGVGLTDENDQALEDEP